MLRNGDIMVDKINGQKYYEYAKINQTKRKSIDSPEFHLDPEKQGVIYEKNEEKQKSPMVEAGQDTARQPQENVSQGVRVELSRQGKEQAEQSGQRTNLSEQIRKFAETAVTFLKSLWDKIWNEPSKEARADFPEVLEERMEKAGEDAGYMGWAGELPAEYLLPGPEAAAQPAYTQDEIRAIFRRGDRKEIEDFLSENGRRHLVKNSDLLTQYDRKGMIIGVDRTDKELILHGNKNEIKL